MSDINIVIKPSAIESLCGEIEQVRKRSRPSEKPKKTPPYANQQELNKLLIENSERIFTYAKKEVGFEDELEVRLAHEPLSALLGLLATYLPEESSDQKAVIEIQSANLLNAIINGKYNYQETAIHELLHHTDRTFLGANAQGMEISRTKEEYVRKYLLRCRIEGFASYRRELPDCLKRSDESEILSDATERVSDENEILHKMIRRAEKHRTAFERFETIAKKEEAFPFTRHESEFEWEHNTFSRIDVGDNIKFSPYTQGQDIIRIIGWAKERSMTAMSQERHQEFLAELRRENSLQKFYKTYFDAARKLNIKPYFFPEKRTFQIINQN